MVLKEKNIVIGVCGGIAIYKCVDLVSKLKKEGVTVQVIMTKSAQEFVAPLTFQTMSKNTVIADMFKPTEKWDVEHISIADKADLFVIAPATANIIGKVKNGIADDFLSTTIMATKKPVLFVPAMNYNMYENQIVQDNIKTLQAHGYLFMKPDTGIMAEGTYGKGRLPEPIKILQEIKEFFKGTSNLCLKGKNVLITAGPTREYIDPVRFITNASSGKMGYAMAKSARDKGANVTIISGPCNIDTPEDVIVYNVLSAKEMYDKALELYNESDIVIFAAAVSDYKPSNVSENKIKKNDNQMNVILDRNPDISLALSKKKTGTKVHIGFCAETENLIENAKSKLKKKKYDLIVANNIMIEGAGFEVDTNIVSILDNKGNIKDLEKMEKSKLAEIIIDNIAEIIKYMY